MHSDGQYLVPPDPRGAALSPLQIATLRDIDQDPEKYIVEV